MEILAFADYVSSRQFFVFGQQSLLCSGALTRLGGSTGHWSKPLRRLRHMAAVIQLDS